MNRQCNLTKRVRTNKGYAIAPAVCVAVHEIGKPVRRTPEPSSPVARMLDH